MTAITDKFGKASIETNYALATTVKTARTVGETVLACYDLSRFSQSTPVFFVTYKKTVDPVTNEVSVTNQTSWKALVNPDNNTLTNLTLAPGYVDIGNDIGDFVECIPTSFWGNELIAGIEVHANPDGTLKVTAIKNALGNDGRLVDTLDELTNDVVLSGGIWTGVAGLNLTMSALAAYINGYKNTVAAVATRAFTPSKDTYVDVLFNTGTKAFSLVYTEVANGAAAPALAANSIRIAKIGTTAAAVGGIKQIGRDSLKNRIYPINPTDDLRSGTALSGDSNGWGPGAGVMVVPNTAQVLKTRGGRVMCFFGVTKCYLVGGTVLANVYVDGINYGEIARTSNSNAAFSGMIYVDDLPPGDHTFDIRTNNSSNSGYQFIQYNSHSAAFWEVAA